MNQQKEIYSFGENDTEQWYAKEDGLRIPCTENEISRLWEQWIMLPNIKKDYEENFNGVFKIYKSERPMFL